jgi:hypothetical protein
MRQDWTRLDWELSMIPKLWVASSCHLPLSLWSSCLKIPQKAPGRNLEPSASCRHTLVPGHGEEGYRRNTPCSQPRSKKDTYRQAFVTCSQVA